MSQCLVVKKEILENRDFWQRIPRNSEGKLFGFLKVTPQEAHEFLRVVDENKEFKERHGVEGIEKRAEWQQIIFYGLIHQGDKIFVYQRGGKESKYEENRLQLKTSVGIGGHIEPFDKNLIDSLYRELDEEAIFKKNGQEISLRNSEGRVTEKSFAGLADIYISGLIKDEIHGVESVHLGLACEINLIDPDLKIEMREEENIKGEMMSINEYEGRFKRGEIDPEFWTQIFVREISRELKPLRGKERI
jgi:predicted NUDIX family phosphoesterase